MAAELDGVEVRIKGDVGGVEGQGEMARQGGGAKMGREAAQRWAPSPMVAPPLQWLATP